MNVLFGSVIYPRALKYAKCFFDSLSKQTYLNFTLLLFNDGVEISDIERLVDALNFQVLIRNNTTADSPTELRIKLLREAIFIGADVLILGDIDDTFAPNRIERNVQLFCDKEDCGFAYNKFLLEDGSEAMPYLPEQVSQIESILEYNFLGLSNTAINMKALSVNFVDSLHGCRTQVFDWYLFSRLLSIGRIGCKINTETYYRLHEDNCIGLPHITEEMISREIDVKKEHYASLVQYAKVFEEMELAYQQGNIITNKSNLKYFWWNLTKRRCV